MTAKCAAAMLAALFAIMVGPADAALRTRLLPSSSDTAAPPLVFNNKQYTVGAVDPSFTHCWKQGAKQNLTGIVAVRQNNFAELPALTIWVPVSWRQRHSLLTS